MAIYKRVVFGSDGSDESKNAALVATKMGLVGNADAVLVNSMDLSGVTEHGLSVLGEDDRKRFFDTIKERTLGGIQGEIDEAIPKPLKTQCVSNTPAAGIVEAACDCSADLIVIGRRGLGAVREFFLGSVSLKVMELADRPVLVVPKTYDASSFDPSAMTILVSTDFSEAAQSAVEHAAQLATALKAKVVLAHILPDRATIPEGLPDALKKTLAESETQDRVALAYRLKLEDLARPLTEKGISVTCEVESGDVVKALLALQSTHDADLMLMGMQGGNAFQRFMLGSFTVNVVKLSPVPVLVTPRA